MQPFDQQSNSKINPLDKHVMSPPQIQSMQIDTLETEGTIIPQEDLDFYFSSFNINTPERKSKFYTYYKILFPTYMELEFFSDKSLPFNKESLIKCCIFCTDIDDNIFQNPPYNYSLDKIITYYDNLSKITKTNMNLNAKDSNRLRNLLRNFKYLIEQNKDNFLLININKVINDYLIGKKFMKKLDIFFGLFFNDIGNIIVKYKNLIWSMYIYFRKLDSNSNRIDLDNFYLLIQILIFILKKIDNDYFLLSLNINNNEKEDIIKKIIKNKSDLTMEYINKLNNDDDVYKKIPLNINFDQEFNNKNIEKLIDLFYDLYKNNYLMVYNDNFDLRIFFSSLFKYYSSPQKKDFIQKNNISNAAFKQLFFNKEEESSNNNNNNKNKRYNSAYLTPITHLVTFENWLHKIINNFDIKIIDNLQEKYIKEYESLFLAKLEQVKMEQNNKNNKNTNKNQSNLQVIINKSCYPVLDFFEKNLEKFKELIKDNHVNIPVNFYSNITILYMKFLYMFYENNLNKFSQESSLRLLFNDNFLLSLIGIVYELSMFIYNYQEITFTKIPEKLNIDMYNLWKIIDPFKSMYIILESQMQNHLIEVEVQVLTYLLWRNPSEYFKGIIREYFEETAESNDEYEEIQKIIKEENDKMSLFGFYTNMEFEVECINDDKKKLGMINEINNKINEGNNLKSFNSFGFQNMNFSKENKCQMINQSNQSNPFSNLDIKNNDNTQSTPYIFNFSNTLYPLSSLNTLSKHKDSVLISIIFTRLLDYSFLLNKLIYDHIYSYLNHISNSEQSSSIFNNNDSLNSFPSSILYDKFPNKDFLIGQTEKFIKVIFSSHNNFTNIYNKHIDQLILCCVISILISYGLFTEKDTKDNKINNNSKKISSFKSKITKEEQTLKDDLLMNNNDSSRINKKISLSKLKDIYKDAKLIQRQTNLTSNKILENIKIKDKNFISLFDYYNNYFKINFQEIIMLFDTENNHNFIKIRKIDESTNNLFINNNNNLNENKDKIPIKISDFINKKSFLTEEKNKNYWYYYFKKSFEYNENDKNNNNEGIFKLYNHNASNRTKNLRDIFNFIIKKENSNITLGGFGFGGQNKNNFLHRLNDRNNIKISLKDDGGDDKNNNNNNFNNFNNFNKGLDSPHGINFNFSFNNNSDILNSKHPTPDFKGRVINSNNNNDINSGNSN